MAVDTADEVRAMAGDVLAQLADPEEYLPTGGGVLVDPLTTSDDDYPGAERFNVSFDADKKKKKRSSQRRPLWPLIFSTTPVDTARTECQTPPGRPRTVVEIDCCLAGEDGGLDAVHRR